ncbi:putative ribonuclease H-like domain-containing protein [Tanacetum coccineum]
MIRSLMYLTSSRPDIMFTYPRNSPFDLVVYFDSDYAGASLDRKSITGLISWQCKKQTVVVTSFTEAEYVAAASCCGQAKHIEYLVGDEAIHKELGDRIERAATTASSFEAEQCTARAIPEEVSTAERDMDVTLAEALMDLLKSGKKKSPKPKVRGISFQDPEEVARREVISPPVSKISAKDKGKAIMIKPEKPLKKKYQIQSDEELALRLHAEEQAEFKRMQKERDAQEEASKATTYEEIDNI